MPLYPTTCPFDCPGACALLADIRDNRLVGIKGDPDHPFTRGIICANVTRYQEMQHGPRIATPLVRNGPKGTAAFRVASWDEALDLVAKRLLELMAKHGAESVLPCHYGGTMGVVQRNALDRLAHRAGFSKVGKDLCYPIGQSGWNAGVGKDLGPDPASISQSDLIILWGINAATTHITLMGHIKQARKNGATLIAIDPYRTRTAHLADHHFAPRPGTDAALALAMMHTLLEDGTVDREFLSKSTDYDNNIEIHIKKRSPEWAAPITGLTPESIRVLARLYGAAKAPFIRIGLGMSRQNNGAVNIHAVSCLPALTGAWRHPGGGALLATGGGFPSLPLPALQESPNPAARVLPLSFLGAQLTNPNLAPPVMALLVSHANPAVSCPDSGRVIRGLQREDLFTVVQEQVMSDTARWADVVLPATTFLEHEDIYRSFGHYYLQHAPPLMTPAGQARSNHEVINELAQRLGYHDAPFTWDCHQTIEAILANAHLPPLSAWPGRWLDFTPSSEEGRFVNGFPQPDQRFHFYPHWQNAATPAMPDTPAMPTMPDHWAVNERDHAGKRKRYPLDFMVPPSHLVLNSTFSTLKIARARRGDPRLWIHPTDAAKRGILDHQLVVVFNDQGRLTMIASVTEETLPGVVLCESNHSAIDFPEQLPLNLLTESRAISPHGGVAYHDNRVEVLPLERDENRL